MKPYITVKGSFFDNLHGYFDDQINKLIEQGYAVNGGQHVIHEQTGLHNSEPTFNTVIYQAMYKKPTKPVKPRNEANDITELDLSKRTINMLLSEGIDIDTLRTMSEIDLLKLPGCGRGTTNEILNELYRDGGMK